MEMVKSKFIAKPDTWFDAGKEVELIDDYRTDPTSPCDSGLFCGRRCGIIDEEVCGFDEFDVVEE